MSKHFKMYIIITGIVGKKRVHLDYLIWDKEVAIIGIFSGNAQYETEKPVKVKLIMNEEMQLPKQTFSSRELGAFVGRKLITPKDGIIKTNKLAHVMDMVISLDELDNTDNLKDRRISDVQLSYHMTDSEKLTNFELVTPLYKRLKNLEFNSLILRIMDRKGSSITDGPWMTIVLHIT